jgi:hypothetical protein
MPPPPAPAPAATSNVDIDALRSFLESIRSSVGLDLITEKALDKQLFHYTDLGGLLGIVTRHDLWLTHARYSNDAEEITDGYQIVREVLTNERQKAADTKRKEYLEELERQLDIPATEGPYVCCFCDKENLLGQWRTYGANGAGVSIEFAPDGFSQWLGADGAQNGLLRIWNVIYRIDTKKSIVQDAINFPLISRPGDPKELNARRAAEALQFFLPTFKNSDFEEEREWRLIFTPNANCTVKPRFRAVRQMLIPYFSLQDLITTPGTQAQPLPIKSVRLGPGPLKALNVASTRFFLKENNYDGITVTQSETPHRGF